MSLFNKLFGGGKKEEKKTPPPPQPPSKVSKQIQAEKAIVTITQQINSMDDQTNKLEYQAEVVTAKAKELMAANKKKEAKVVVGELAQIKKKIENINIRKKVLRTQRTQVEAIMTDIDTAESMEMAVNFMKGNEDLNEKINEIILDTKEIQMNMEETNRLMKQIADNNNEVEEETDELYKEFEAQVNQQKADKIQQNMNKNPQLVTKPVSTVQFTKPTVVQDDLSKWLN